METMTATAEVAELFGMTVSELFLQGLISFMREKKRQTFAQAGDSGALWRAFA